MAQIEEKEIVSFDLTEIINGEEIMGPSPFGKHQRIVAKLYKELSNWVDKKDIGEVFISPLDVIFEERTNRLQPDIIYIKKENLSIVQDWIRGVPDMVIEVVSKGTVTMDTVTKKDIYERYGVPEMWLVFPEQECIEVFFIENNRYKLYSSADGEGIIKSEIIGNFKLDIKRIFNT